VEKVKYDGLKIVWVPLGVKINATSLGGCTPTEMEYSDSRLYSVIGKEEVGYCADRLDRLGHTDESVGLFYIDLNA